MSNMTAAIWIGCAVWCAALMFETCTTGLRMIFSITDSNFTIIRNKLDQYEAYRDAYERDHHYVPERPLSI